MTSTSVPNTREQEITDMLKSMGYDSSDLKNLELEKIINKKHIHFEMDASKTAEISSDFSADYSTILKPMKKKKEKGESKSVRKSSTSSAISNDSTSISNDFPTDFSQLKRLRAESESDSTISNGTIEEAKPEGPKSSSRNSNSRSGSNGVTRNISSLDDDDYISDSDDEDDDDEERIREMNQVIKEELMSSRLREEEKLRLNALKRCSIQIEAERGAGSPMSPLRDVIHDDLFFSEKTPKSTTNDVKSRFIKPSKHDSSSEANLESQKSKPTAISEINPNGRRTTIFSAVPVQKTILF